MNLDEGYQFGLGAFETIAVKNRKALFLDDHIRRINNTLDFLEIEKKITNGMVNDYIRNIDKEYYALKLMVSEKNTIISTRDISYTKEQYEKGFKLGISEVRRNNTSPFTYHKTFNYGDCIVQKRRALKEKIDDMIFLNHLDEICECSTSNIFFVKDNKLFTPKLSCGLLPGIIREFIRDTYKASEVTISIDEIDGYDECFVTNSLLGIMPVLAIGEHVFSSREYTDYLLKVFINNTF